MNRAAYIHLSEPDASDPKWDSSPVIMPLSQGLHTVVDAGDFEWLSQWKWCAGEAADSGLFYAMRTRRVDDPEHPQSILMHRAILRSSQRIDHWDGNGLNNRRKNLRLATPCQNAWNRKTPKHNTSGFKGVHLDRLRGLWIARCMTNGRRLYLGYFKSKQDAISAYVNHAKISQGDFSITTRLST